MPHEATPCPPPRQGLCKVSLPGLTCRYSGQRPESGVLSHDCALDLHGQYSAPTQVRATWWLIWRPDGPDSTPDRSLSTSASAQVNRLSDDFARALGATPSDVYATQSHGGEGEPAVRGIGRAPQPRVARPGGRTASGSGRGWSASSALPLGPRVRLARFSWTIDGSSRTGGKLVGSPTASSPPAGSGSKAPNRPVQSRGAGPGSAKSSKVRFTTVSVSRLRTSTSASWSRPMPAVAGVGLLQD